MPDIISKLNALSLKLEQTESALSAFWHLAPNLFIISKRTGEITKVNRMWEESLGWKPQELIGRFSKEFIHPDDMEKTDIARDKAFINLGIADFRHRWRSKDGSYKTISWASSLVHSDTYIYGIGRVVENEV